MARPSSTRKALDAYLAQVEEAKQAGPPQARQGAGACSPSRHLVGSGLDPLDAQGGDRPRPAGESFLKEELLIRWGYQPVYTPHIGKIELYQTSGHYPYYKDSQFPRPAAALTTRPWRWSDGLENEHGSTTRRSRSPAGRTPGIPERMSRHALNGEDPVEDAPYEEYSKPGPGGPGEVRAGPVRRPARNTSSSR